MNCPTTRILICPADSDHTYASNFNLSSSNISYFLSVSADETYPQGLLSGDDNLTLDGVPVKSGLVDLSSNTIISWTSARHRYCSATSALPMAASPRKTITR